jgi:uncharacterized protein
MTSAVQNKQQAFERIQSHQSALRNLGAARLGLFGSFVRGEQESNSDVDILVEFEPGKKKLHNFLDMADYLEEVMARKVDLLTWEGMAEFVRKHIANEVEFVTFTD